MSCGRIFWVQLVKRLKGGAAVFCSWSRLGSKEAFRVEIMVESKASCGQGRRDRQ
jgi:hypothetical protein